MGAYAIEFECFEIAFGGGVFLSPDFEGEIYCIAHIDIILTLDYYWKFYHRLHGLTQIIYVIKITQIIFIAD